MRARTEATKIGMARLSRKTGRALVASEHEQPQNLEGVNEDHQAHDEDDESDRVA